MRVVFDPNLIISATLSPGGSPAQVYELWRAGAFELVVNPRLLWELDGVLGREKFTDLVPPDAVAELVSVLTADASSVSDPADEPDIHSSDPDDDYLIALVSKTRSVLVSGDRDLLELSDRMPVYSPVDFLRMIRESK